VTWRWAPVVLIAGILFALSSLTPTQLPGPDLVLGWDKVLHFVAYAILALAGRYASPRAWLVFGGVALFGCCDELHQSFVPGRDASLWDLVADVAGAATALVAWRLLNGAAPTTSLPQKGPSQVT
jgi:VanZ family protein